MALISVTDDSFDKDVLQSDGVVLVDFWAEWCGPCRQIAPKLEELAEEMKDDLTVAKLDIEANMMTPGKYGVHGIPTLILFKGGQPISTKTGNRPKTELEAWIKESVVAA